MICSTLKYRIALRVAPFETEELEVEFVGTAHEPIDMEKCISEVHALVAAKLKGPSASLFAHPDRKAAYMPTYEPESYHTMKREQIEQATDALKVKMESAKQAPVPEVVEAIVPEVENAFAPDREPEPDPKPEPETEAAAVTMSAKVSSSASATVTPAPAPPKPPAIKTAEDMKSALKRKLQEKAGKDKTDEFIEKQDTPEEEGLPF